MAFDVYPIAHTDPLLVGPGATSPLIPFTEQATPAPLIDMVIRVVMLGDGCSPPSALVPDPTIILKAGTGDEVDVPVGPLVSSVFNTPGMTSHVADVMLTEEANNVYRIDLYISTPGSAWQIRIRNNDAAAGHQFTWVVASTDAESRQPWIHVTSSAVTLDALTNQTITRAIEITNKGTGPLTVALPPAPGSGFAVTTIPGPIPPNECDTLGLTFTGPALPGATAAVTMDIPSNDAIAVIGNTHNKRVTLSATTRKLEVALMLDGSGSMADRPNGTFGPIAESRWAKLTMSAKQFLDLLAFFGNGLGRFAVGVFPDIVGTFGGNVSSADVQAAADISGMTITTAKNALDPLTPDGGTPMGKGIERSIGATAPTFGYFESGANSVAFNRRFLVLMSDGAHNSPTPPASPKPPDFYQAFKDKKVKALTIGYGDPATAGPSGEVDHVLLNTIASESFGQFFFSGATNDGLDLPKSFRTAITAGLSLDPIVDPPITLSAATGDFRREVTILPYDTKVSFVVNWVTDNLPVNVTIVTPLCEVITAAAMPVNSVFNTHSRYRIFSFPSSFLRNAANPALPRFGTWKLIVSAPGLAHSEKFEYEVITESRLRLNLSFDRTRFYAGDTFRLDASLTLDGLPLRDATVMLSLTRPGQAPDKFVTGTLVTKLEFAAMQQKHFGKDVSNSGLRLAALAEKGIRFKRFDHSQTIPLLDPQGDGVYSASIANTAATGNYDFYVTALGQTPDGVSFRREQRVHVRVEVRPDPGFTVVDIFYLARTLELITAIVRVTPRDKHGNPLVIDPALDPEFQFIARDAEFIGEIEALGDGTYSRTIQYKPSAKPVIQVRKGEVDITPKVSPARIADLTFVNQVVKFRKGREAKDGANKHADARRVLGDVAAKKDQFLALGAGGDVTVAVKGSLVRAAGKDDVTVFVNPTADLRPYRVEALAPRGEDNWVLLGTSAGASAAFSLAKGSLKTTRAIRITDLGRRALNTDLSVDDAPGINLAGVGVASVGKAPQ